MPTLVFSKRATLAEPELIQLLQTIKNEAFNLDNFEIKLKEKYCSEMLFETDKGLECRLSKSLLKNLHAKRILFTNEPSELEQRSISLILLKYGEKDRIVKKRLEKDFESLAVALKEKFKFVNESYTEGGEAAERLAIDFAHGDDTKIQILRLFGGCFSDQRIIISIYKEKSC